MENKSWNDTRKASIKSLKEAAKSGDEKLSERAHKKKVSFCDDDFDETEHEIDEGLLKSEHFTQLTPAAKSEAVEEISHTFGSNRGRRK